MGTIKTKVTHQNPCKICGKPDYCFRLEFDDGGINHCCARISSSSVVSSGVEYVCFKAKDTNIGTYYYYMDREVREAFISSLKKSGNYKKTSDKPRVHFGDNDATTSTNSENSLIPGEWAVASDDILDTVYRRFLELLKLSDSDYECLKKEWNQPSTGNLIDKVLEWYPIRTLAPEDRIRKLPFYKGDNTLPMRSEICKKLLSEGYSLEGIPGFYFEGGIWNYSGSEGILFPIYNALGQIVRVRLRETYPCISATYQGNKGEFNHVYSKKGEHLWFWNPKEGDSLIAWSVNKQLVPLKSDGCPAGKASGKYKNLSSVWEKVCNEEGVKTVVNGYGWGTRSGSSISLYAKPGDDWSVVYVTEGEKKAMIANMLLNVPVISVPGTGTFSKLFEPVYAGGKSIIDILVEKGMKLCVIAYDADKNTNINVLNQEKAAVALFIQKGIRIAIGEWNANFGKGLDDILVTGVRPSIYLCT